MNGEDLTPTQHAALATLLKHGELSQNHLGRLTAMDPSTISIVVRKLLKNGLIDRRGSKKDQRLAMIALTDKGTATRSTGSPTAWKSHGACSRRFRRPSRQTLLRLLHRIGDGDDDFDAEGVRTFQPRTGSRACPMMPPSRRRRRPSSSSAISA